MAFDTLEYARRLKGAGFSEQQAEVLAEATRDLVAGEMVTKSFLQSELEKVSMRLTIRMGTIAAVCVAALAAIIKHSPLVGDFLDLILREQFRLFAPRLTKAIWEDYLSGCRARDPEMPKIHNELAAFSPYWTWPSTS